MKEKELLQEIVYQRLRLQKLQREMMAEEDISIAKMICQEIAKTAERIVELNELNNERILNELKMRA